MPRRRTSPQVGEAALADWLATGSSQSRVTAVRFTLEELAERAPGNAVEIRVPPFGAVQALSGPTHRRGTPPAVIETDADTWLGLATGRIAWDDACARGLISTSGARADLSAALPLFDPGLRLP